MWLAIKIFLSLLKSCMKLRSACFHHFPWSRKIKSQICLKHRRVENFQKLRICLVWFQMPLVIFHLFVPSFSLNKFSVLYRNEISVGNIDSACHFTKSDCNSQTGQFFEHMATILNWTCWMDCQQQYKAYNANGILAVILYLWPGFISNQISVFFAR
jgi:hypothetical protein